MLVNKDEEITGCRTFEGTIYNSARPAGEIQEILRLSNNPEAMNFPKKNFNLLMFLRPATFGLRLFNL